MFRAINSSSYDHFYLAMLYRPLFVSTFPLAIPSALCEKLKIGAGTPPVLTICLAILYHEVRNASASANES